MNKLFKADKNCAVCVSGGADSALMLYKVLQNNKEHTHIFTYANNTLMLKNVTASTAVVNKCVELTGNHRVTHHVIHNEGDKPNGVDPLFDMVEPYSVSLGIKTLFIGVTKNPPKEVTDKFVDFTALALKYGFHSIRARKSFFKGGSYGGAEWWHFQYERALTRGVSKFGEELLKVYSLDRCKRFVYWEEAKDCVFGKNWF